MPAMITSAIISAVAPAVHAAAPGALLLLLVLLASLSAVVVRRMIGVAVMDIPGGRSAHDRPVPKGGGVGMLAAILLGLPLTLALLPGGLRQLPAAGLMMVAVLLLGLVSWLDDVRQFGVRAKLLAQIGASILTIAAVLSTLPMLPPAWMLAPVALVALAWLLLVTNAMNFIDGINGLAAGCTAIVVGLIGLLGWLRGDALLAGLALPAAAGLAGFLPFNYPSARIFLGDVGSQVCGLLAGALALFLLAAGDPARAAPVVPLMLAGILWDVLFTLGRRLLVAERLTQAHRGHLYQVASRSLMPAWSVAALHWGFAIWGALVAVVMLPAHPVGGVTLVLLPQLAWTQLVRHAARRVGLGRWSG